MINGRDPDLRSEENRVVHAAGEKKGQLTRWTRGARVNFYASNRSRLVTIIDDDLDGLLGAKSARSALVRAGIVSSRLIIAAATGSLRALSRRSAPSIKIKARRSSYFFINNRRAHSRDPFPLRPRKSGTLGRFKGFSHGGRAVDIQRSIDRDLSHRWVNINESGNVQRRDQGRHPILRDESSLTLSDEEFVSLGLV